MVAHVTTPAGERVPTADQRLVTYGLPGVITRLSPLCAASEVWTWKDSQIEVHVLREQRYQPAKKSALFPDLHLKRLGSLLDRPTVLQAVKAFHEVLRR